MDKSEGKDWFAKTLNSFTEETAKVYKISRLKLESSSLNKTKNEKMNLLSRKLISLIDEGKVDVSLFEPEYSAILSINKDLEKIDEEISDIKSNIKFGTKKDKDDDYNGDDKNYKEIEANKSE